MQREMHRTTGWKVQGTQCLHLGRTTLPALPGKRERERAMEENKPSTWGDKQHQTYQDTRRAADSATPILQDVCSNSHYLYQCHAPHLISSKCWPLLPCVLALGTSIFSFIAQRAPKGSQRKVQSRALRHLTNYLRQPSYKEGGFSWVQSFQN